MNHRNGSFGRGQGNGRGRGRGRGQMEQNGKLPPNAWNTKKLVHGSSRRDEGKENNLRGTNSKVKHQRLEGKNNEEDDWKERETARESRLEKAKSIRESAADKFSHLLDDSDSSDEELRGEEILRKTMDDYRKESVGMYLSVCM